MQSKIEIVSHNGITLAAKPVSSVSELVSLVEKQDYRLIAIDEVQFFDEKDEDGNFLITKAVKQFADEKRLVIVAGLDKDFKGNPFGPIGELLALSDEKNFHTSVCAVCGAPATLPQRLINGKPASKNDPVVLVGANESYEPRCRRCHVVQK